MSFTTLPALFRGLSETQSQCGLAALCGILSHILYFIHGERDLQALRIVFILTAAQLSLVAYLVSIYGFSTSLSVHTFQIDVFLLAGLFSSMTIYRLAFHRLYSFPGPFWGKVTRAYSVWLSRNTRYAHESLELHKQYGDFVRIGPEELHINNVEALIAVHGPQSKCIKSATYGILNYHGVFPLPTTLDKAFHKEQRRVWDQAFSIKALNGYEPKVRQTVNDWLDQAQAYQGKSMNISHWTTLIAYDTMGKVGFSADWGAVKDGRENPTLHLLEATFTPLGKLGRWTWPLSLMVDVLEGGKEQRLFHAWASETTKAREQMKDQQGDIIASLIKNYHDKGGGRQQHYLLEAEAQAILVAATDTVSNTLAWMFYYTAKDPQLQHRLREALEPVFNQQREPTNGELADIPLLTGIINEAMRLESSVALGSPRDTPPEGMMIGDRFIPGNVTIFVVQRALHRNARYFPEPDSFIPERWFSRPELLKDKRAFAPFIIGPYNCVGRQLALMEARMVLAHTVWNYDMAFAPGEDGSKILNETIDIVILKAAKLDLVFRKRN